MTSHWVEKPLGEIVTLQRGFDLPVQDREAGTIPVIGSNGTVGFHNALPKEVPIPGVTVGRSGSVGAISYCPKGYWPLNTVLYVKDFHGNDPAFLSFWLQLFPFKRYAEGVSVPTLNRNSVSNVPFPIPEYSDQTKIASALFGISKSIGINDAALSTAQELKRSAMRELFTRGLRGEPQKETEVGLVPDSWELFAVADAVLPFRFDRTKQLQTNRYLPTGQWPIIDQGQKQIAGYTNDEDAIITPAAPIIIFGDHTRTLKFVQTPFALGADGTKPLTAREGWNPRYLFHALCNVSVPSRGYNRHYKQFAESVIAKPSADEQSELAQIFDAIDDKIDLHQRKQALLQELFRALLHSLMGGTIRVTDLDLSALETEAPV